MDELLHPDDSLQRQRDKLASICAALMKRVEQAPIDQTSAYAQFERAALLDEQVRQRTMDLERALDLLNESNARLAEANREIETARSNLNEAIESVDEGFALFDADDRLLLFNSRFCQPLFDVVGRLAPGIAFADFVTLISASAQLRVPEGATRLDWAERRMRRHREDRVVFNIALENDRWMQVSEHRTQEGGTVILQTDITTLMLEQKRERAQLVDSQAKMLRATLDHLDQGISIFDREARLVGWNRKLEQMIKLPAPGARVGIRFDRILDQMVGRMAFTAGHTDGWLRSWARAPVGRQAITFELTDGDGEIFNVFAQEMPDGGFVISFSNITGERRSAAALRDMNQTLERRVQERTEELGIALRKAERANEYKNRFVAAASHDLLQPLSAAKLYLAKVREDDTDLAEVRTISDKAESALRSAEDIIKALLDISRLDVGRAALDIQPVLVGETLESLTSEMIPAAEAKGLRLTFVPSSASVRSDPVFFRRILQNLISNAIRYTDTGRILVGVRRRGSTVRIEVRDTGRGIRPEDHGLIFKEFGRVDSSNSEGLGLGLAIVERACTALNHRLGVTSQYGAGSCFFVDLDAHTGATTEPEADPTPAETHGAMGNKVVLLVENDEDLANAMTLKFESWGAHVIHAPTGASALELLAEIDLVPDALVLDYHLGTAMTGLDLYHALKQRYGVLPGVVISADPSESLGKACAGFGLSLLHKPLEAADLHNAVNLAIAATPPVAATRLRAVPMGTAAHIQ